MLKFSAVIGMILFSAIAFAVDGTFCEYKDVITGETVTVALRTAAKDSKSIYVLDIKTKGKTIRKKSSLRKS